MPSIYEEFDDASIIVQNAIKAECPKRVDIAQAVTSYDADSNIKAQDSTCAVNESETSVSCTTTVTVTNEVLKEKLSAFSSTTATLKIWFDDNQFVTFKPKHTTENVATVTLDTSGTATVTFETPYESGWGDRYGIDVASYFPNE